MERDVAACAELSRRRRASRHYTFSVEIDPYWLLAIVVLVALTVLLTGPGLWSEKWGWKLFERVFGKKGPDGPRR